MHAIEGASGEPSDANSPVITGHPSRVLVIDSVGILQSKKKGPTMLTLSDFQAAFIKRIVSLASSYSMTHVVFVNCLDQSLKKKTVRTEPCHQQKM